MRSPPIASGKRVEGRGAQNQITIRKQIAGGRQRHGLMYACHVIIGKSKTKTRTIPKLSSGRELWVSKGTTWSRRHAAPRAEASEIVALIALIASSLSPDVWLRCCRAWYYDWDGKNPAGTNIRTYLFRSSNVSKLRAPIDSSQNLHSENKATACRRFPCQLSTQQSRIYARVPSARIFNR